MSRRFTTTAPAADMTGEGVQFAAGPVAILWGEGNDTLDAYVSLAAYQRQWPDHTVTWTDDDIEQDGIIPREDR